MLILTRGAGESLLIGDEVRVKVLGIRGGQVRLGVEAPRDIEIFREEVAQQDHNAKPVDAQEAGQASTTDTQTAHGAASEDA